MSMSRARVGSACLSLAHLNLSRAHSFLSRARAHDEFQKLSSTRLKKRNINLLW
jgi:hypothetical protein